MKTKAFLLLFLLIPLVSYAQMKEPVHWSYSQKQISKDEVLLIFKADIDKHWHLYTQFGEDGGPMKLVFNFEKSKDYKLIDKTTESPKPIRVKDKVFNVYVEYIEDQAVFTQKIKVLSDKDFLIKGEMEGQACSSKDGSCVPLFPEFEFKIKGKK